MKKFTESASQNINDIITDEYIEDILTSLTDSVKFTWRILRSEKYWLGYGGSDGSSPQNSVGIKLFSSLSNEYIVLNKDDSKVNVPAINAYVVAENDPTDIYESIISSIKEIRSKIKHHGFILQYLISYNIGRLQIDIVIK